MTGTDTTGRRLRITATVIVEVTDPEALEYDALRHIDRTDYDVDVVVERGRTVDDVRAAERDYVRGDAAAAGITRKSVSPPSTGLRAELIEVICDQARTSPTTDRPCRVWSTTSGSWRARWRSPSTARHTWPEPETACVSGSGVAHAGAVPARTRPATRSRSSCPEPPPEPTRERYEVAHPTAAVGGCRVGWLQL
jgi:hypothetical protein